MENDSQINDDFPDTDTVLVKGCLYWDTDQSDFQDALKQSVLRSILDVVPMFLHLSGMI